MNKRYFEVSAKHMANFGIEGPRVFEVIEVETNMTGGRGFDAFLTLDTPVMLEDCYIGAKLVVAAARGRFVDPEVIGPLEKHNAAMARQLDRIKADPESSTVSREGARAFEAGASKTDCPYAADSHIAKIWNIGYDAAKGQYESDCGHPDEEGCAEYARRFAPV